MAHTSLEHRPCDLTVVVWRWRSVRLQAREVFYFLSFERRRGFSLTRAHYQCWCVCDNEGK